MVCLDSDVNMHDDFRANSSQASTRVHHFDVPGTPVGQLQIIVLHLLSLFVMVIILSSCLCCFELLARVWKHLL